MQGVHLARLDNFVVLFHCDVTRCDWRLQSRDIRNYFKHFLLFLTNLLLIITFTKYEFQHSYILLVVEKHIFSYIRYYVNIPIDA